jgi:hypothetical protein
MAKTGSNRFGSIFPVFSVLARFFPVWLGFSGLARFFVGSVWFFVYKTETEPAGFFKNLIGFFFGSVFSVIFFLIFSV